MPSLAHTRFTSNGWAGRRPSPEGGTADAFGQSRADLFELCVPLAEAIALAGKDGENRRVRGRCEWY